MLQRSFKNTSVLALAMSVLASLLPSSPANAVESCATILTDLKAQHLSTTSQLNAAIAAHADANGKVSVQFLIPALTAYASQTNTANARLQVLLNAHVNCGTISVETVVHLLMTDLGTVGAGATIASQVVLPSQSSALLAAIVPLDSQLVALTQLIVKIYLPFKIDFAAAFRVALMANPTVVQALGVFPKLLIFCRIPA